MSIFAIIVLSIMFYASSTILSFSSAVRNPFEYFNLIFVNSILDPDWIISESNNFKNKIK